MLSLERRQILIAIGVPVAILIPLILAFVFVVRPSTARPGPTATAGPGVLVTVYLPPGVIFGLAHSRGIVTLPHPYGYNVLGDLRANVNAVYLVRRRQAVRLPGTAKDQYVFDGSIYLAGSGYVQEWAIVGTRGRFALLHLSRMVNVPDTTLHRVLIEATPGPYIGYDQSAQDIGSLIQPPSFTQRTGYVGGTVVGYTGHPTLAQYGNATSPLRGERVLVITNDPASAWFYSVENRAPVVHHHKHHHHHRHHK